MHILQSQSQATRKQYPFILFGLLVVLAYASAVMYAAPVVSCAAWFVAAFVVWRWVPASQRKYLMIMAAMIIVMSITPVQTATTGWLPVFMLLGMAVAVALPIIIGKYVFKTDIIHLHIDLQKWRPIEFGYVIFASTIVPVTLFVYFFTTDAAHHWPISTAWDIALVFGAIMAIGMWEEFFFIAAIYGILRRYLHVGWANLLQALLFTTFLYQVGFQGWIIIPLLLYTLYQGYIYSKTNNLLINLVIHAIVDLFVFIALIAATFR